MNSFNPKYWNKQALLTCDEMRAAEQATYGKGVSSFSVMQKAGEAIAEAIRKKWKPCRALVLCGPGNNGGDGFIVAESLRKSGWDVSAAQLLSVKTSAGVPLPLREGSEEGFSPREQALCLLNQPLSCPPPQGGRNAAVMPVLNIDDVLIANISNYNLVVDALYGTGLTRPIEGAARTVLDKLAQTKIPVVAVDLPSGVNGDTGEILGIAPQAVLTVTFFRKKLGHVLLPGARLCGEIIVADIGIMDDVLNKPAAAENAVDLWRDQFPFPKPEGHKYARGHALIFGGAVMTGAARLAARAAQRVGAGLVTLGAPQSAIGVYSALESVIVRPADALPAWQELLSDAKRNAVLIGPGLGIGKNESNFVLAALETKKPCVLDADAISNFANKQDELLRKLHPQCVLTPHEGEFARLFGSRVDAGQNKLARTREAAKIAGCTVLLKGADTIIAAPDGKAVINNNAPPWLATAGAGDVLAGMILGLLAQNMHSMEAVSAAAWLHGAAANNFGPGLIAEDLVEGIPAALKGL